MAAQSHGRTKVFISYSHKDSEWLERLRVHLRHLEREGRIESWDDTKINPGSRWREEIAQALAAAKVGVLLVSADFIASDFINSDELPPLLNAAEKEEVRILLLILSPSRFESVKGLSQFQAVNDPSKPLIGLSRVEQEAVLVRLSRAIEDALNYSTEATAGRARGSDAGLPSNPVLTRRTRACPSRCPACSATSSTPTSHHSTDG